MAADVTVREGTWVLALVGSLLPVACSDDSQAGGAGGAGTGGGVLEDGGVDGADNPELDAKCTPMVTVQLEDTGPGGQIFGDAVVEPVPFVQEVGRTVCRILYREPDEVRDANHITLVIRDDPDFPGWKTGDVGDITVMISTDHLADVQADGRDVEREIRGVLLHEMTHMYQHDDKAPGEGGYPNLLNVVEGVADFVRIRAGCTPQSAMPSKEGVWDDAGYWKPAFFMLWIDMQYPDLLHQLNLTLIGGDGVAWTPDAFEQITGNAVADHWSEFQAADCCAALTHTCCH